MYTHYIHVNATMTLLLEHHVSYTVYEVKHHYFQFGSVVGFHV